MSGSTNPSPAVAKAAAAGPPGPRLTRFAGLSIAAAVATIALKTAAFAITGSVGLLSDALESGVNLVAAVGAFVALAVAARPADEQHHYGHSKAEYFSAGVEGAMVLVAAAGIVISATARFLYPRPLDHIGPGLAVSVVAAFLNGVVSAILLRAGRRHRSITLTADGRHLLTDVWTSAGVVVGVAAVGVTGWERMDPLVAMAVGVNIVFTGWRLVRRSVGGLMDTALPDRDRRAIEAVLDRYREGEGVRFHALRTRDAGARRFVSVHVLVPGAWTVQAGHDLLERLEADLDDALGGVAVFTHLEPVEDPASWADGRDHPEGRLGFG
ncbi:MAG TPA: cation diffusion facilitator family transporter [Acidimicrobiia bacterium]|nr:cation diffusion facilitator family transporter [Acidimicrobiia bacterium]